MLFDIKNFYELIHKYNLIKKKVEIKKELLPSEKESKIKNNISNSPFFSNKFNNILNKESVNIHYKINVFEPFNTKINIYTSTLQINYIKKLLNYILFIEYLAIYHWNFKNIHPLNIYLVPLNIKKNLPIKYEPISIENINSAATNIYFNEPGRGDIFIWRKSEMTKVLVHELLHSFNYDQNLIYLSNKDTKIFPINSLNLNETYTEFGANIICLGLNSYKNRGTFSDFKSTFTKKVEQEMELSCKNVRRLLNYNKLKNVNDFLTNKYEQNASIFSYVVLKSAILFALVKNKEIRLFIDKFPFPFEGEHKEYVEKLYQLFNYKYWSEYIDVISSKRLKIGGDFYFTTIH